MRPCCYGKVAVWCRTTFSATCHAVPRMNAYEIHVRLRDRFKLGPKVLRVGQISGWISNEVGRRKQAAEAATHSAANAIESANAIGQAGADQGVIASKFSGYLAAIRQQEEPSQKIKEN